MAETEAEFEGEKCQKCGEVGDDRRTLWMACLYAMDETGVPFEQVMLRGTMHSYKGEKVIKPAEESPTGTYPAWTVPEFEETPVGPVRDQQFFTLRVCKTCRSTWMQSIKRWFYEALTQQKPVGSGIFVRTLGACREVTEEEWQSLRAEADARRNARR